MQERDFVMDLRANAWLSQNFAVDPLPRAR